MQQHNYWPVGRAGIDHIEHKLTTAVLVHAFSMPHQMPGALSIAGF